jgi:hypothetical protein
MPLTQWAADDELTADRLNEMVDAIDDMTEGTGLAGVAYSSAADAYVNTWYNSNATGKGIAVFGSGGAARFFATRRNTGNDSVMIGQADGTAPTTSKLLVYWASSASYVATDSQIEVSGNTADSGGIRGVAIQTSGGSHIRGVEAQARRDDTATTGRTWAFEGGVHTEVSHASGDGNVGMYLASSNGGWVGSAVRANSGVFVTGDAGWNNYFVGVHTDLSTVHFRVSGQTSGNDRAGDVMSAGDVYSQRRGSTYRVGMLRTTDVPASETWGGMDFNTTASGESLQIGAASTVAHYPISLAPNGGGVIVGMTAAQHAVLGGVANVLTIRGTGAGSSSASIGMFKSTVVPTPWSGFLGFGPLTDDLFYRKTSAGATVQMADAATHSRRNRLINGDARVQQYSTISTSDNAYVIDGMRLLMESASGWVFTRSSSNIPTISSSYGFRFTVGATNNAKGGGFWPILYDDAASMNSDVCSVQATIRMSDARVGDIRMGLAKFTGTADTGISGDPISAWGAAGTNPTLAANWAFVNTPANLSVTTDYATFKLENQSITGANNLALIIWCDDKTTTTGDWFQVHDVQIERGSVCTSIERPPIADQIDKCMTWYEELGGDASYQTLGPLFVQSSTTWTATVQWKVRKRAIPSLSATAVATFAATDGAGAPIACNGSLTYNQTARDVVSVTGTVAAGLSATAGIAGIFLTNNSTSTRIYVQASP